MRQPSSSFAVLLGCLALAGPGGAGPAAAASPSGEPAAAAPDPGFARFVAAWPGHYDNAAQHRAQVAAGVPEAQRNLLQELRIVRVDLPAFGPQVFYAEWFAPGAEHQPLRQRIYALEHDATHGRYVLRLHIWPQDPAFVARTAGAWREPARLAGVTPRDMAPLPGCDVYFRAAGAGFEGEMEKGTCRFAAMNDPSRQVYSWSRMKIVEGRFSYKDGWYGLDGSPYMTWAPAWFEFERR
ncbi:MAG: chromophore lyase CpcT/CpeT [Steroidobacteraceae bacterium]|jgi:hypothetical protein|nr:chromophore lyase CpcT/CpeT [Steroidobacteraceae bacterium]